MKRTNEIKALAVLAILLSATIAYTSGKAHQSDATIVDHGKLPVTTDEFCNTPKTNNCFENDINIPPVLVCTSRKILFKKKFKKPPDVLIEPTQGCEIDHWNGCSATAIEKDGFEARCNGLYNGNSWIAVGE